MKKLLGIFLLVLFVISLAFSINNEITIKSGTSAGSPGYTSIMPIPPPDPPPRRGC